MSETASKSERTTAKKSIPPKESGQNFTLFTLRNVVPVLVACLLALTFRYSQSSPKPFKVERIPVSLVLKQNLRLAKHSWEHGVLTHALLELQNPELTLFAGPGYGHTLRSRGNLEAFPDGKLPKCASEASGSSWGRYDKWTNVKGLRYAAEKIDLEGRWLFNDGDSAADAASLGWAALLLERAGATDPMVPVEARRNLFGEAADRMVKWLFEENPKLYVSAEGRGEAEIHDATLPWKDGEVPVKGWAISHQSESIQLWADSVSMVPPFLAAYAVARQNGTWLRHAVEQISLYREILAPTTLASKNGSMKGNGSGRDDLWRHIVSQPRSLEGISCCHDEGLWLTGNAWALAGIIRVYGVLERWESPRSPGKSAAESSQHDNEKVMKATIRHMAQDLLFALKAEHLTEDGLLPNYLSPIDTEHSQWNFGDAAGTALVASSVYRSVQLGVLGQHESMLKWADSLYNAVAKKVHPTGLVGNVTTVSDVPAKHAVVGTSEAESFVLMMFAARRDCVKLKICT